MGISRAIAIVAAAISATTLAATIPPAVTADAAIGDEPVGGIGLRLTEAPASAADDPRSRVHIVDHLAPGAVIERQIEVSNTTDSAHRIALFAGAASIDDGTFVGAAATITFPDEGTTAPVETQATGSTSSWSPLALVGLLALLATCGIAVVVVRRRSRRRAAPRGPAPSGALHRDPAPASARSTT